MAFDWKDYLDVADSLSKATPAKQVQEAYTRASVSRAYYAAHWVSRMFLEKAYDLRFAKHSAHTDVVDELTYRHKPIGAMLHRLHGQRLDADYRAGKTIAPSQSESSLSVARQVIFKIEELCGPKA